MKVFGNYTQNYYKNTLSPKANKNISPTFSANNKAVATIIRGQESCWKLHEPNVFEKFINADEALKNILAPILKVFEIYKLPISIKGFLKFNQISGGKNESLNSFFEFVKTTYGVDLKIPPTVYRFIGDSEKECLLSGEDVKSRRYKTDIFDVTINPDLNWNKHRVTFKPKPIFSILDSNSLMQENPGSNHEYFYHFLSPSYSLDDVEKIEQVTSYQAK